MGNQRYMGGKIMELNGVPATDRLQLFIIISSSGIPASATEDKGKGMHVLIGIW